MGKNNISVKGFCGPQQFAQLAVLFPKPAYRYCHIFEVCLKKNVDMLLTRCALLFSLFSFSISNVSLEASFLKEVFFL